MIFKRLSLILRNISQRLVISYELERRVGGHLRQILSKIKNVLITDILKSIYTIHLIDGKLFRKIICDVNFNNFHELFEIDCRISL